MNTIHAGFTYIIETVRDGVVIDTEVVKNLIPVQGLNDMLSVWLKHGTQAGGFYVGLYEGDYTPTPADTAAAFPAAATELTAYAETARVPLVLGTVADGAADNSASRAEFTGTIDGKLARGGFITTAAAKGATTGVLASAVKFPTPKPLDNGTVLRVTASFQLISA